MSMKDLEKAFDLIEKQFTIEEIDFCGNQVPNTIRKAEIILNVVFPKTYRAFIEKYGCGGVGSFEIYGIIKDEEYDEKSIPFVTIPNAVWTTLKWRRDFNHPLHLIIISDLGDGSVYCLDTSQMNIKEECPVVIYPVCKHEANLKLEIVAEDFGKFFLDMVQNQIEYKKSDYDNVIN